jgi:hypothetical protein
MRAARSGAGYLTWGNKSKKQNKCVDKYTVRRPPNLKEAFRALPVSALKQKQRLHNNPQQGLNSKAKKWGMGKVLNVISKVRGLNF